jgi:hypothetical protein
MISVGLMIPTLLVGDPSGQQICLRLRLPVLKSPS